MMTPAIEVIRGFSGIPGWLSHEEAAVLRCAVRSTAPDTTIVELGRWCGRSLVAIAEARAEDAARRPIVSIDSYPEASQASDAATTSGMCMSPSEAKTFSAAVVEAFGLENVTLDHDDALEAAAHFRDAPVGLLYIDDDHSGDRVIAEIEAWEPHLAVEAEVCIHDFYYQPYGIEAAVDRWLLTHREWVMVEGRGSMARFRRRWRADQSRAPAVPAKLARCDCDLQIMGEPGLSPPAVSVLYNTFRLGGLDCLKAGLDRQTMDPRTFEVVIVDALYPYRTEPVKDLFRHAPYRVKHVNPTRNPFPRDHGNLARNDAIRAASGQVCVWWCDYSIAQDDSLERHLSTVARSRFMVSSLGIIRYGEIHMDALHDAMRAALPFRTIDDYVEFVEALPADSPLFTTIFREDVRALGRRGLIVGQDGHGQPYELRGRVKVSLRDPIARDARLDMLNGPVPAIELYYAKNEATAREVLVAVNGWDESFDDGHSCDDIDIARRLCLAGSALLIDKGNECFVPNPRPFFPLMRSRRPPIENRRLCEVLGSIGRARAIQGLVNELDQIPEPEEESAPREILEAARVP